MKKILATTILTLAILFSANAQQARADDGTICAAVLPCKNGEVISPFNEGTCANYYAQQCKNIQLDQMSNEIYKLSQEVVKLRKENKTLKSKVVKLRNHS